MTTTILEYALLAVVSYLIGAIPWGYIVGKAQGIDVRRYGSGKTGATNTLRTLGRRSSALVFACDVAKGLAVVYLARYIFHSPTAEVIAALAAVVGHNWSVYIRFFGGRGVSISFGSIFAISPLIALISLLTFVGLTAATRYVSLGSVIGVGIAPFIMLGLFFTGNAPIEYVVYTLLGAPLVIFAHWDNIRRLRAGRERKLGEQAEVREA